MNGVTVNSESDSSEYVEVDPTGRYGRYNEILGKGASKTVYRAFDEYEGIEVAWNQVKLYDFLQSPEDLERLYSEIHLLKTLKHRNIMKFYTSWVDTSNRNINFVTEMFTSGTLRQYRLKHKRVNIRAVKHWCRQILKGLLYLHSHEPPVIHRDLKCDNIFVNGNQGEVKIGDLGLAAILPKSHAARCVGTPEFMAPEVYEEEYNELVDIYSFGMCILEMVTFEYPYSECNHPAQIYKKVISGKKPEALYKVKDPEVRQFVEKCLATASNRLPAIELLKDPFLQTDDYESFSRSTNYMSDFDFDEGGPLFRQPIYGINHSGNIPLYNGYSDYLGYGSANDTGNPVGIGTSEIDLFSCQEDEEHLEDVDITIKGRRREDDGIFFRLRIADKGRIRNIYFPFDLETDTALSVSKEMVAELDLTDQDVTKIADMIDKEISALLPDWKSGLNIEQTQDCTGGPSLCDHCASSSSLLDSVSFNNDASKNLHVLQCSKDGCAAVHGRFEEITYQVQGSEQCTKETSRKTSRQDDGIPCTDIWAQRDEMSEPLHSYSEYEGTECDVRNSPSSNPSVSFPISDDYENEIRQELRWLKAKYEIQLRELKDQQLGVKLKHFYHRENGNGSEVPVFSYRGRDGYGQDGGLENQILRNHEIVTCNPEHGITAKSFYTGNNLVPHSLHRATSLPVDAVDV